MIAVYFAFFIPLGYLSHHITEFLKIVAITFGSIGLGLVSTPILIGLAIIGAQQSYDLPISSKTAFYYFNDLPNLIAIGGLFFCTVVLAINQPFLIPLLLIIPTLFSLAPLLMVDKKQSFKEAIENSCCACWPKLAKIYTLLLITITIVIASTIPLGLGLIWTLPMAFNTIGILYRIIFGLNEH